MQGKCFDHGLFDDTEFIHNMDLWVSWVKNKAFSKITIFNYNVMGPKLCFIVDGVRRSTHGYSKCLRLRFLTFIEIFFSSPIPSQEILYFKEVLITLYNKLF